jgi:hypothetical protein
MAIAIRELPPTRLSISVAPPSGQPTRWARDERRPENVASGVNFSTTAPGGFESFSCTLPRRPETSYSDLERLSNVVVRGVGGVAWEGRLEASPRVSGTQMAVSPSAVGWQAHLEDDKSASMVYVDRDMGKWRGTSRARQIALLTLTTNPVDGSLAFDNTAGLPAIEQHIQAPQPALAGVNVEDYYDAGVGNLIGSIYWDRTSNADVASQPNSSFAWFIAAANTDDTLSGLQISADQQTGTGSAETGTFTPTTGLRFGILIWQQPSPLAGTNNYYSYVRRLTVWGNHGLTKRGTAPADGLYASDVIYDAVRRFAPKLRATSGATGTVYPTTFIIPHLAFNDRTTAAEMISAANRFQINDWMVWEGPMDGQPTFYLYPRGSRGRAWRARVGPSQLSEAGPSMERLWNGVIVRYSDVDGTSKTVGPTNSGCDTTSADCTDTDPLNPANKLGIRRWTILEMQGVSTPAGATEVGKRFLEQTRLLDTSGAATITGYCEDDRGTKRPAWQMRAGDTIQFVDAADTSSRRIVKTSYSADNATCSIDLDAPPDGLADLLERLQVVLVPLGL